MRPVLGCGPLLLALAVFAVPATAQVVDYEIDVSLDPVEHRLRAVEKIRWTNSTAIATDELWFHLYLNAFAGSKTTFMREFGKDVLGGSANGAGQYGWVRIESLQLDDGTDLMPLLEFVRPNDGNQDDFSVARVTLPSVVPPGGVLLLELEFEAQLPWIIARTGFVDDFHLVGQWFPKIAVFEGEEGWNCHQFHASSEFFADFGSYEVTIEIPEDWVLGATGVEVARAPRSNERQSITYRAQRVHDFAWITAPADQMEVVEADFEPGRDVPMVWLDRARSLLGLSAAELELPPMKIRLILPRVQRALAPRMVRAARLSIAWFGLFYGSYPYAQVTVVSPPKGAEWAGGMEYPTFITTGASHLDEFPPYSWRSGLEAVTVHEFGHQYFQGLLASNEFEEAWLDEGLTSYAELECMTAIASDKLVPEIRPYSFWVLERLALVLPKVPITLGRNSWDYRHLWNYFLASYSKAAVTLRTVEGLVGRETMARGLRNYVEQFSYRHPTGADLEAVLSEVSGMDLGDFFAQTVAGDAEPDWGVAAVHHRRPEDAAGHNWDGEVWRVIDSQESSGNNDDRWLIEVDLVRHGDLVGAVEVELLWADGSSERRVWEGTGRWERWKFEGPNRLQQIVLDPEGRWALETRRANNYWRD